MTYAQFRIGMQHLARAAAQEKIRIAEAMNAAQAKSDDYNEWRRQQRASAGYLH